jgi:hypothetical protein
MSEIPFKKIEFDRGKPVIVVEDQKSPLSTIFQLYHGDQF